MIKYQREQSKIEHSLKKVEINTRNESAYFILEKEDSVSNHDGENLNNKVDGPGNELKRVSSYEDTDNCIQLSKDKTTMDDTEYEVTSATHKIQNKSYPAYPYRSNIFEKGLDYIPESVQRKFGIRFVSGDYSEYYAYKLLRRRSAELCRCENKDLCETSYRSFENLLPKSNSDADISEENKVVSNDSVNEYDKLRYFARNETKQSNRYDRVLGNFVKGGTLDNQSVSGTARYQKRSNSV